MNGAKCNRVYRVYRSRIRVERCKLGILKQNLETILARMNEHLTTHENANDIDQYNAIHLRLDVQITNMCTNNVSVDQ